MKKIFAALMLAAACHAAGAQSINQSVQVTNQYESRLGDVRKLGPSEMNVPDSLTRFDYKFDYTVFDTEYKGAYEFSPYLISMKPEASVYDGNRGFFRIGAGYQIRPELDFVFSPYVREKSAMSIYARGGGYFDNSDSYDLGGKAGFGNRWLVKHAMVKLGAEYDGNFDASSYQKGNAFHSAAAGIGVKSMREGSYFYYDVNADYRFSRASVPYGAPGASSAPWMSEHLIGLNGTFGPVIKNVYRLLFDFDVTQSIRAGDVNEYSFRQTKAFLKPHFLMDFSGVKIDAGVHLQYLNKFRVVPSVEIGYNFFKGKLYLCAGFDGGMEMNTLWSLKSSNSRFSMFWMDPILDRVNFETFRKMDAYAAIKGHLGARFQYALKGGYKSMGNMPVFASNGSRPVYALTDMGVVYGNVSLSYKSESVDFHANVDINHSTDLQKDADFFLPSLVKGDIGFAYTWNRRITVGVTAGGQTAQKALGVWSRTLCGGDVPGYVDAGVNFHYRFSRRMGVWAKGGNLACMEIQTIPGYKVKDPYGTLGISLVF